MTDAVVGIDLGGTKVRVALALAGTIVAERVEPTAIGGGAAVVAHLVSLSRFVASEAGVAWKSVGAVGVGSPGVIGADGKVLLVANIPGLADVHLRADLRRSLRVPVLVENDANIAALGERHAGAAVGCEHLAVLTVGTGIGLGLVVDGRLVRGARGMAGEVAYLPFGSPPERREAHRRGALEIAAGGAGMTATLRSELRVARDQGTSTALTASSSPTTVLERAADGDVVARRVVAAEARLVAIAVASVVAIVNPEVVVLAGGIGSHPALLAPVQRELRRVTPLPVTVRSSPLGDRSGVIGAVALALSAIRA